MNHRERIETYFIACGEGTVDDIASHFTDGAVVYDTNIAPMRTAGEIGAAWVKVRERWQGARWSVDSLISDGQVAAIEWSMTGTDPKDGSDFVFRGSEHYRFEGTDNRIDEIRQYWVFDRSRPDTGLIEFVYPIGAQQ